MTTITLAATGFGVLSWLLSFPVHGAIGSLLLGPNAAVAAHSFVLGHATGLLINARFPSNRILTGPSAPITGALLAVIAAKQMHMTLCVVLYGLAGILTVAPAVKWVGLLSIARRPLMPFVAATVGANLWCMLSGPLAALTSVYVPLALTTAGWFAVSLATGSTMLPPDRRVRFPWPVFWPLLLFTVVAAGIGGLMYRVLAPTVAMWPGYAAIGYWPYVAALIAAAPLALWRYETVGTTSLSLLGVSLLPLVAASAVGVRLSYAASYVGTLAGLALADMFIWIGLMNLARAGVGRAIGFGLSVNLLVIFAAGVAWDWTPRSLPADLSVPAVAGAGLMLLVIPVIVPRLLPYAIDGIEETTVLGIHEPTSRADRSTRTLTPAEQRVFELVVTGKKNREIAEALFISPNTVKFHMKNILRKTGCGSRDELKARQRA